MAKRVYELAKILGKPIKTVVFAMKKLGINKTAVATLTDEEVRKIRVLNMETGLRPVAMRNIKAIMEKLAVVPDVVLEQEMPAPVKRVRRKKTEATEEATKQGQPQKVVAEEGAAPVKRVRRKKTEATEEATEQGQPQKIVAEEGAAPVKRVRRKKTEATEEAIKEEQPQKIVAEEGAAPVKRVRRRKTEATEEGTPAKRGRPKKGVQVED